MISRSLNQGCLPCLGFFGRWDDGSLGSRCQSLLYDLNAAQEERKEGETGLQQRKHRQRRDGWGELTLVCATATIFERCSNNDSKPVTSLSSATEATGRMLCMTLPRKALVCLSTSNLSGVSTRESRTGASLTTSSWSKQATSKVRSVSILSLERWRVKRGRIFLPLAGVRSETKG